MVGLVVVANVNPPLLKLSVRQGAKEVPRVHFGQPSRNLSHFRLTPPPFDGLNNSLLEPCSPPSLHGCRR